MHKLHYYSTKNVLLAAFVLLCFVSPFVRGRRLRVLMSDEKHEEVAVVVEEQKKLDDVEVRHKESKMPVSDELVGAQQKQTRLPDSDDLVGLDYNPTSNKPPVHN